MSELQATLEFSIELHKFYNVDLFQRGFYQIRTDLRSSQKVPCKIEVSLPRTKKSDLIFPPSIVNGIAVSKTFQILYRNEEVQLDDVIHYRIHIVLDSAKIEETLRAAEFSLEVELWFSEDSLGMEQHSSILQVCSRSLQLDFAPLRGLHHHLPVLFDYFHLSCVSLTVHGSLLSIHQPYLASPRSGRGGRKTGAGAGTSLSTMESVLFGPAQLGVKYGTSRTRLSIACRIYQEVCTLLLAALESLQLALQHLASLIPDLQRPAVRHVDCRARMKQLAAVAETLETEEEFLLKANSDISQLCAENILVWNKFLDAFTLREVIRRHLAQVNHCHRVRRFAEGFFTMTNPRKAALCCLDAKHQHSLVVSEAVRRSAYFQSLPGLAVGCRALDGGPDSLPIIFEDVYSDGGLPGRHSLPDCGRLVAGSGCTLLPCSKVSTDLVRSTRPVQPNTELSSQQEKKGKKKKKISLPVRLTEDRMTTSLHADHKIKAERKRSVDNLNLLSPSLSPDMKLYFKEKLRSNLRLDPKTRKTKDRGKGVEAGRFQKGASGYSHLECCANIPYNLEEEPELLDTITNPKEKDEHEVSFTSRTLEKQHKPEETLEINDDGEVGEDGECKDEKSEGDCNVDGEEELAGMARVRQIVLANCRASQKPEGSSDSSVSEESPVAGVTPGSPDLRSPQLVLARAAPARSRSEEPAARPEQLPAGRPRHRSESVALPRPRPALPLPPAQFRDPAPASPVPRLETAVRDGNFARARATRSSLQQRERPATAGEGSAESKMSRSNTISFGDGGLEQDQEEGQDEPGRKGQGLSASLQGIPFIIPQENQAGVVPLLTPGQDPTGFTCCDWVPRPGLLEDERLLQRVALMFGPELVTFARNREQFRRLTSFPGSLYSERGQLGHSFPYFTRLPASQPALSQHHNTSHLVVCVHGLDGNSADLRLIKTYLELALPSHNLEFLMSEINQTDTFLSLEDMTRKLVNEIIYHVKTSEQELGRLSFIGHSLGCILVRSAIQHPELARLAPHFHTFLSLSGPHLGTIYNNSGLVNAGMWVMQRWKKSGSLQQLALKDHVDIRQTFMYKLSENSNLELFRNLLLAGSSQDKYVPIHSARVELCKTAVKDSSVTGAAYREMVNNILSRVVEADTHLVRYDIHHALPNNTNSLIGRAAHIAVLDSELFIEKFLVIAVLKYFQ